MKNKKYYKIISGAFKGAIGTIEESRYESRRIIFYPVEENYPYRIIKNKNDIGPIYAKGGNI